MSGQPSLWSGSATADITPPLDVPYLGFEPRQALFEGIHDRLWARVLVVDDGRRRICLVGCDGIGFGDRILGPRRAFTPEAREAVSDAAGTGPEDVMIFSTHAHSTPETLGITPVEQLPGFIRWMETVIRRMAEGAARAVSGLSPCVLRSGSAPVFGISRNRRPRYGTVSEAEQISAGALDPEVRVSVFEDGSGNAAHVLVGYQCHPVTMQVQSLVSADYPGVVCDVVEGALPGCRMCTFVQGAAGNINPIRDDSREFRDVGILGRAVGGAAVQAVSVLQAGEDPPAPQSIGVSWREVDVTPRRVPHIDLLRREEADAEGMSGPDAPLLRRRAGEARRLAEVFACPRRVGVQAVRIGEMALVGIPGELFTEWGLRIRAQSPAQQTLIAAPANGWIGYLLSDGEFADGGYETALGPWTQTDECGARAVVAAAVEALRELF